MRHFKFLIAVAPLWLLSACTANTLLRAPEQVSCADESAAAPTRLRIASYNMKAGLESSLEEIAAELEKIDADLIALQEVDFEVDRTGRVDQAGFLAERLGMQALFAAAMDRGGGAYGVALLSRFPVQSVERVQLDGFGVFEPRVALDAEVCLGKRAVHVLSTHADFLNPGANIESLAKRIAPYAGKGVVVAGDLNVTPESDGPARLTAESLTDLFSSDPRHTYWPGQTRLDYVLTDETFTQGAGERHVGDVKASDHFPIWVDLTLPPDFDA